MKKKRFMGLDIGEKRIGVAMSDPGRVLASPLTIITEDNPTAAIAAICELVEKHDIGRVVAGLPLSLDGSVGRQALAVKAFVEELKKHLEVPVTYRDERLSTVTAEALAPRRKKGSKKERYDAMAAAVILQSYLEERL